MRGGAPHRRAAPLALVAGALLWGQAQAQQAPPAAGAASPPEIASPSQTASPAPTTDGRELLPPLPMPIRRAEPPQADDTPGIDRAYGAYQAGSYIAAFRAAARRLEADPTDAAAMTLLGELLELGQGMRQEPAKAAQWYELAARLGDRNAIFALGMMRLEGRGVPRDEAIARALLRQAADKGHGPAAFNLSLPLLLTGKPDDLAEAVRLLRVAAAQEVGDAQHALAVLMLDGRGVPQDIEGGADMMARAAANGSLAGEVEFALLQFTGRGVGRDERAAARGFARAAQRGNAIAQNRLARIMLQGRWLPRDPVQAMGWHLSAKAQGLEDEVLEAELVKLPAADRARAEAFAQDLVTANALTRAPAAAQSTASEFK